MPIKRGGIRMEKPVISQKAPIVVEVKKGEIGVLAGKALINHFVMDHIKALHLRR